MTTPTKFGAPKTERELLQPSRWKMEAGGTVFFGDMEDDRRLTWTVGFYDTKNKWWEAKISVGPNGRFERKSWNLGGTNSAGVRIAVRPSHGSGPLGPSGSRLTPRALRRSAQNAGGEQRRPGST